MTIVVFCCRLPKALARFAVMVAAELRESLNVSRLTEQTRAADRGTAEVHGSGFDECV